MPWFRELVCDADSYTSSSSESLRPANRERPSWMNRHLISVLAPGTTLTRLHAKAGAENSRYLVLLPAMTSEELARIAYRKFKRGKKVIVT